MTTQQRDRLLRWVRTHGCEAWCNVLGQIVIGIEWTDRDGQHGIDYYYCADLQACRDALGY